MCERSMDSEGWAATSMSPLIRPSISALMIWARFIVFPLFRRTSALKWPSSAIWRSNNTIETFAHAS